MSAARFSPRSEPERFGLGGYSLALRRCALLMASGLLSDNCRTPLCGIKVARTRSRSLDHLVGAGDESPRDLEAEHLRGAQVEEQFDFRGLLDRQIGRLIAFENPAGVDAGRTECVRKIGSIAHQAASRCELASLVDRGHRVTNRQ